MLGVTCTVHIFKVDLTSFLVPQSIDNTTHGSMLQKVCSTECILPTTCTCKTAAQFYSLSTLTSVELSVGLCRSYYKLPYQQQLVRI